MSKIKGLGAAFLLLTAAWYIAREWLSGRRRVAYLTAWSALLRTVRTQISCYATPLSEILKKTDPELLRVACGAPTPEEPLPRLCAAAADRMTGESARQMAALAGELGTVWREEQLTRLDEVIATLEEERRAAISTQAGHMRLVGTLSVCGTLCILLLLW